MADLELLNFDQSDPGDPSRSVLGNKRSVVAISGGEKWLHPEGGERSAPWTAQRSTARIQEETETSFTCCRDDDDDDDDGGGGGGDDGDDDVQLLETNPQTCTHSQSYQSEEEEEEEEDVMEEEEEEEIPELFLLSDEDLSSDGPEKSTDYGFIIAVSCLLTGISLVAISYTVPRDVRVDPDSVSAREMERLEREKARVGAHLDRCVIAGLCLLTLGGVLLSTLLMISMWQGEMMRRKAFAYSKHAANKLYGSMSLRAASSPGSRESCSHASATEEDLEVVS